MLLGEDIGKHGNIKEHTFKVRRVPKLDRVSKALGGGKCELAVRDD
jgi:hypothetical protein